MAVGVDGSSPPPRRPAREWHRAPLAAPRSPAMTSRPLFVLCGPRRGSTLLRYILDTHSQIASPGEIELGALCAHLEEVIRCTQTDGVILNRFTAESLAE